MRLSATFLLAAALGSSLDFAGGQTTPVCTGLCLQQLPPSLCPNGGTTSISGVVYAPNGTDPLPNVQVYIPNDVVQPFAAGVQCPVVGALPSGSPLVGATTAVDGSFTITNVPVGTNIPLVIVTGKWRRQIVIPSTTACANTALTSSQTSLPQNQSQGDIPLFAVATGSVDSVECVLRKVGISDIEFTDPAGTNGYVGRIQIYNGSNSPGAHVDSATPSQTQLMENLTTLEQYDVLMLPCQGGQYTQPATSLSNFISFANAGGRVYSSHFSYVWMYNNAPFNGVVNWDVGQAGPPDGTATINQNFSGGLTLAEWLQEPAIGASTTQGQIAINTLKHDFNGVVAPTQNWMTLNNTALGSPVMQFVFDTPIAATNQCGRVLFNEYHVESASGATSSESFPQECSSTAMTPQEKLLEYMLFELTDQGGAATLTPATQDFGSQALNLPSAAFPFTLTNNSTFSINAPVISVSGPFTETNNCSTIAAGASCTINVVFTPTALGAATGTLSANAGATSLLSALTGTGVPDLTFSLTNLSFGSLDVGGSASQSFSVTNAASAAVPVTLPVITPAGEFSLSTTCPGTLAVGASCSATVTFKPTATGPATASITDAANGATPAALTGNGIDFTIAAVNKAGAASASGSVIAGDSMTFYTLTTPLAGFANPLNLTCLSNVPGSTCTIVSPGFTPTSAVTTTVNLTTTSEYTVIGYTGGVGRPGVLWLVALSSGVLLLVTRRRAAMRWGLLILLLGATTVAMSGCSGKLPAKNAVYTAPGTYSYTVSATDGFLVHTATYSLTVTSN